jgi:hypothetical protein
LGTLSWRSAAELRDRLGDLNEELERERGVRIALRTGKGVLPQIELRRALLSELTG